METVHRAGDDMLQIPAKNGDWVLFGRKVTNFVPQSRPVKASTIVRRTSSPLALNGQASSQSAIISSAVDAAAFSRKRRLWPGKRQFAPAEP